MPVRLQFRKVGRVRFISHRDVARAFERAFRIEQLPVAFTEGFAPRPRISFGLALATGYESEAEYLDVELTEDVDPRDLAERLSDALPEGMDVLGLGHLEARAVSLQQAVTSASYRIRGVSLGDDARDPSTVRTWAKAWVQNTLQADALPVAVQRKGREVIDDLRPAIRHLSMAGSPNEIVEEGVTLQLDVSTQPKNIRPTDVLGTLGHGARVASITRTAQWIERDGSRLTPLEADTRLRAQVGAR